MRVKKPIHPLRRKLRLFLYALAGVSFLFSATMSYFYIGMKRGTIAHEDIAPVAFATDIYLYQTRAYWSGDEDRYTIAKKLVQNGLFDRAYYEAGHDMMQDMALDGYPPAQKFVAAYFEENPAPSR
ncbi:MAG: hypothetical protein H6855_02485 [Rhodospirillales bacterium]|nr:hypothetical protein [Rhodospirillales bacterium]MCB9964934.1 hypothetical protein [Rhodospirillales bacterium]MCB9973728.1 hypothetical protein [Rhodospirillales bacterium]